MPKPPSDKTPANKLLLVDCVHREVFAMFCKAQEKTVTPDVCRRWAVSLQLGWESFEKVDGDYLLQTLMQYEGRKLTRRWADIFSRQLVARVGELMSGVIHPYEFPCRAEWIPMEIYSVRQVPWHHGAVGQELQLYCLAGHPAGHVLPRKVPDRWLSWLAYQVGFSRRLPYTDPQNLTGLRFWAYAEPADDPPVYAINKWSVDVKMRRGNQGILKRRLRLEIEPEKIPDGEEEMYACPRNHPWYCHECLESVAVCNASCKRGLS